MTIPLLLFLHRRQQGYPVMRDNFDPVEDRDLNAFEPLNLRLVDERVNGTFAKRGNGQTQRGLLQLVVEVF